MLRILQRPSNVAVFFKKMLQGLSKKLLQMLQNFEKGCQMFERLLKMSRLFQSLQNVANFAELQSVENAAELLKSGRDVNKCCKCVRFLKT